ncbi:MAG: hypothetical protein LBO63_00235 [Oscillospiraceae bacterium]|jgi:RHS repeat-associated protein|nr:hypothetical protein [Oscillospiraceae bacterium]
MKNPMGDIIGIMDCNGDIVCTYEYDAWGKITAITGNTGIANANPLRYRGYVYDAETGLYYCGSRYYDPAVGRFISGDNILVMATYNGCNIFAYCENNPINRADPDGYSWYEDALEGKIIVAGVTPGYDGCGDQNPLYVSPSDLRKMGFDEEAVARCGELNKTISNGDFTMKKQVAHFLAQIAYETNYGKWLIERGDVQSKKYYPYYGAGYIQLTGEKNYRAFAEAMGDPRIMEGPAYVAANYAWASAGWFWASKNLNDGIANKGWTAKGVSTVVHGDASSWEKRRDIYDRFLGLLG